MVNFMVSTFLAMAHVSCKTGNIVLLPRDIVCNVLTTISCLLLTL